MRKLICLVPHITAGILLLLAAIWAVQNWDRIATAFSFSSIHLCLLIPLVLLSLLLSGLLNQVLAAHLGAPLRFQQWASLAFASTLANYTLPLRAGAGLRATYLKRRCDLPIAYFASAMMAMYVIALLVNSVLGLCALGWLYLTRQVVSWPVTGAFSLAAGLCLLLFLSPDIRAEESNSRFIQSLNRFQTGWQRIRTSPGLVIKSAIISSAQTGVYVLRLHVAFAAVGGQVTFSACFLMATLTALSMFITITPAALGIREAAIIFAASIAGVAPEVSLLAGTMDRAAAMLVLLILGPLGTVYLSRDMTT